MQTRIWSLTIWWARICNKGNIPERTLVNHVRKEDKPHFLYCWCGVFPILVVWLHGSQQSSRAHHNRIKAPWLSSLDSTRFSRTTTSTSGSFSTKLIKVPCKNGQIWMRIFCAAAMQKHLIEYSTRKPWNERDDRVAVEKESSGFGKERTNH